MLMNEEFLKKLRSAFDLNIYEVKIWTALLSKGVASAGELSDISDVPRSRSYDVLESLEKKGFVIMKLGKPIKYIAVKPEEILKRVKNSIKGYADNKVKVLEKVRDETVFKELELLYKQGIEHIDISTISGAIKGRKNIYDHLETMLSNATKTVNILTSPTDFVRKAENFRSLFKKLKDKGVKIKIATKVTNENKKLIKDISEFAEIKNANGLSSRFCVIDSKDVMFMILDDKDVHENYDTGIWVNTPFFASALDNLFIQNWPKLESAEKLIKE